VKPECVERFKDATLAKRSAQRKEPGIARFERVVQQQEVRPALRWSEVYRTAGRLGAKGKRNNIKPWRDTVTDMMAETRVRVLKFESIRMTTAGKIAIRDFIGPTGRVRLIDGDRDACIRDARFQPAAQFRSGRRNRCVSHTR